MKVAILSFSNISRDARVLRQIEYLSPCYAVSVMGYGISLPGSFSVVPFYPISQVSSGIQLRLRRWGCCAVGRVLPQAAFEYLYWSMPEHQQAYSILLAAGPDIIHANDLDSLPVAVRVAKTLNAKIILDLHEFAPLEMEDSPLWWFYQPYVEYMLHRYALEASASITVGEAIARRYDREYGFHPVTIINAPSLNEAVGFRPTQADCIRLIHHGGAMSTRRLEWMIQALALVDTRYELHFMLLGDDTYRQKLKLVAEMLAPNRVFFHPPVAPAEIVTTLNQYDIGFYLLHTDNYNNSVALPNKFFDFIQAGLGICIGPSPEMARLIRQHGFGVSADSFEPQIVANELNRLTVADINRFKQAALEARKVLCADVEMEKMLDLYRKLAE